MTKKQMRMNLYQQVEIEERLTVHTSTKIDTAILYGKVCFAYESDIITDDEFFAFSDRIKAMNKDKVEG